MIDSSNISGVPTRYSLDFNNSFKRGLRYPLDEGSIFTSYQLAIEEKDNPLSNIYKGQIISILSNNKSADNINQNDNEAVPYIVQEYTPGKYEYERIMTLSYTASILNNQDYVYEHELGFKLTGVGKWYTYTYTVVSENPLVGTYSTDWGEIFNDYENNQAGPMSHVEGYKNTALNTYSSHAEGMSNIITSPYGGHAEGLGNNVRGSYSHAEGVDNTVEGEYSHAAGAHNRVSGHYAHASGISNQSKGNASFSHGTEIVNEASYGIGFGHKNNLTTIASYAFAQGEFNRVEGYASHVEGIYSKALGNYSHAEGYQTTTTSTGHYSHSEGQDTFATAVASHAEGKESNAIADYSHAEGQETWARDLGSHSEGLQTSSEGQFSHAEGHLSIAKGNYSHAEGKNTLSVGSHSHAEGWGTEARGETSHTQGFFTQAYNSTEFSTGTYSKSYTGEDNDNHLQYCEIYMEESGGTIFTIGDGEDNENRHNILAIHQNGDSIKSSGVSYYVNEVYAPVSYSYVESLGISAYLTTVLSALLENPKYTKPWLGTKFVGQDANYRTTGVTTTIQWGSTINQTIGFRAAYVVPNYNDIDPKYLKDLGNRLGYSTCITEVNYRYYDINEATYKDATYVPGNISTLTAENNRGDIVTAPETTAMTYLNKLQKNKVDDMGIFSGWTFTYNTSTGVQTIPSDAVTNTIGTAHVYGQSSDISLNTSFKPISEQIYTLAYMTGYSFTGSTQMYFQQLANKMTYIPNDGLAPTDKFGEPSIVLSYVMPDATKAEWKLSVKQKYYYGFGNMTITSSFNPISPGGSTWSDWFPTQRSFVDGTNHGDISEPISKTVSITGGPLTFWIAIPSDNVYNGTATVMDYSHMDAEQAATDASVRTWANENNIRAAARIQKQTTHDCYFKIQTAAATGVVDTGITASAAMSLKKVRTANTVGTTGLHYDVYYVNGSGNIPTGTLTFSIKRVW